jgi:hypothetical protein
MSLQSYQIILNQKLLKKECEHPLLRALYESLEINLSQEDVIEIAKEGSTYFGNGLLEVYTLML